MTQAEYEQELMAKYELSTYLDGLCDALHMTKPQIRKAIKIIMDDNGGNHLV